MTNRPPRFFNSFTVQEPILNRLISIPSQILRVSVNDQVFNITLDSGATVSYMRLDIVKRLGLNIYPNDQLALLADKKTRMASVGEIDCLVSLGNIQMRLRALIMKSLQTECFGGTTFHNDNDITPKIKEGTVVIHGKYVVNQSNSRSSLPTFPPPSELTDQSLQHEKTTSTRIENEAKLNSISLPFEKVIYPSDFLSIPVSSHGSSHISYCIVAHRLWSEVAYC